MSLRGGRPLAWLRSRSERRRRVHGPPSCTQHRTPASRPRRPAPPRGPPPCRWLPVHVRHPHDPGPRRMPASHRSASRRRSTRPSDPGRRHGVVAERLSPSRATGPAGRAAPSTRLAARLGRALATGAQVPRAGPRQAGLPRPSNPGRPRAGTGAPSPASTSCSSRRASSSRCPGATGTPAMPSGRETRRAATSSRTSAASSTSRRPGRSSKSPSEWSSACVCDSGRDRGWTLHL